MVEKLKFNLLGYPSIRDLKLLAMVNQMNLDHTDVISRFLDAFSSLGSLSEEFIGSPYWISPCQIAMQE